jgi:hypothetical protein
MILGRPHLVVLHAHHEARVEDRYSPPGPAQGSGEKEWQGDREAMQQGCRKLEEARVEEKLKQLEGCEARGAAGGRRQPSGSQAMEA